MLMIVEDLNGKYREVVDVPFSEIPPERASLDEVRRFFADVDEAIEAVMWEAYPERRDEK